MQDPQAPPPRGRGPEEEAQVKRGSDRDGHGEDSTAGHDAHTTARPPPSSQQQEGSPPLSQGPSTGSLSWMEAGELSANAWVVGSGAGALLGSGAAYSMLLFAVCVTCALHLVRALGVPALLSLSLCTTRSRVRAFLQTPRLASGLYWAQVMANESAHYLLFSLVLMTQQPLLCTHSICDDANHRLSSCIRSLGICTVFIPVVSIYALVNVASSVSISLPHDQGLLYV